MDGASVVVGIACELIEHPQKVSSDDRESSRARARIPDIAYAQEPLNGE